MAIKFVPVEIVLTIHADLIGRYGGLAGVRDFNLLESALAQPQVTLGGKYAHKTLRDKAAAYGFHVCKNHPFIDGNKRIAFTLMDIFLQMNRWEITAPEKDAYMMMMQLADGRLSKAGLSKWLKDHSTRIFR